MAGIRDRWSDEDRRRGWLPVPHLLLDLFAELDLGGSHLAVFLAIERRRLKADQGVKVSHGAIVKATGLSKTTVKVTLIDLVDAGVIEREHREPGDRRPNVYTRFGASRLMKELP